MFALVDVGPAPDRAPGGRCNHPERLVVGHPFNPVYLLPLVEVCGGEHTAPATRVARAADVYRAIGMRPLRLDAEIDGFVADRLLEALWREALWLVHDGFATVSQIDDAIRFGAGLRWSAMGTFLVYRIAGGEAGMRHFMAQFGPALQWPWSKLTDVPELTDELLDRLVAQSDEQAGGSLGPGARGVARRLPRGGIAGAALGGLGHGEVVAEHDARWLGTRASARRGQPARALDLVEVEVVAHVLVRRVDVGWWSQACARPGAGRRRPAPGLLAGDDGLPQRRGIPAGEDLLLEAGAIRRAPGPRRG